MTQNLTKLKQKIYTSWNSADYETFGQILEVGVHDFVARLDVSPQTIVLDVACGTGNCAIPLAQWGAQVTGVDIAPALLAIAREKTAVLNLDITFDEGDAEALPYPNNSFNLVTSSFGVVFAPRQALAASELLRVCQPNGTIALMAWTAEGFFGQMFKIQAKYAPPPPDMPSNTLWGDPQVVGTYFSKGVSSLRCTRRTLPLTFATDATGVVAFFRQHSRALRATFGKLDAATQAQLQGELEQLWNDHNTAVSDNIAVNAEYLEILAVKDSP
ncbi:MAG: methyltransferase domain-containing protein [Chloroflexota bacterium]